MFSSFSFHYKMKEQIKWKRFPLHGMSNNNNYNNKLLWIKSACRQIKKRNKTTKSMEDYSLLHCMRILCIQINCRHYIYIVFFLHKFNKYCVLNRYLFNVGLPPPRKNSIAMSRVHIHPPNDQCFLILCHTKLVNIQRKIKIKNLHPIFTILYNGFNSYIDKGQ